MSSQAAILRPLMGAPAASVSRNCITACWPSTSSDEVMSLRLTGRGPCLMTTSFSEATPRKSSLTPEMVVVWFQLEPGSAAAPDSVAPAVAGASCGFCSGAATLCGSSSGNGTVVRCKARACNPQKTASRTAEVKSDLILSIFAPAILRFLLRHLLYEREQPARLLPSRLFTGPELRSGPLDQRGPRWE